MKTTKTKAPRPRVMWANYYPVGHASTVVHASKARAEEGAAGCVEPVRVAVIPLADTEAIVERAAEAIFTELYGAQNYQMDDDLMAVARAGLTAAGIPCATGKGRK